jgi:hypothetical protein
VVEQNLSQDLCSINKSQAILGRLGDVFGRLGAILGWDPKKYEKLCVEITNRRDVVDPFVKEEPMDESAIEEMGIRDIYFLQSNISDHFRNGQSMESAITSLRGGLDPLATPCLLLNVMKVRESGGPSYFTFDHRRLYCMRQAGCRRVKVCVRAQGRYVDELAWKARHKLTHDQTPTCASQQRTRSWFNVVAKSKRQQRPPFVSHLLSVYICAISMEESRQRRSQTNTNGRSLSGPLLGNYYHYT